VKRSQRGVVVLIVLLVGTNAWWAYRTLDNGVTQTYLNDSMEHASRGFNQAVAILPLVARGANRDEIVSAARQASKLDSPPFEKDGYVFVGELGLKFDSAGKFLEVKAE
jgi:hypothetical protein